MRGGKVKYVWPDAIETDECVIWPGYKHQITGYGYATRDGRRVVAHRVSYERYVRPIPPGLQLDHLCRVRACVNPRHLEPVTAAENLRRSPRFGIYKTHCPRDHEYTPENTYLQDGHRSCIACRRAGALVIYYRRKARVA